MTTPLKARLAPNKLSKSSLLEVFDEEDASAAFDLKKNPFFCQKSIISEVLFKYSLGVLCKMIVF